METETSPSDSCLHSENWTYQADPEQSLSEAVLAAVASESGVDALELAAEFGPLYDAIDPSALDSLFRSSGETDRSVGAVTFAYADYRITVDGTGKVALADRD